MTFPSLPDWLPWWVPILVLVPAALWVLAMLVLPFSVIGLKSRLEGIEVRLDELQSEIRSLALRLPESPSSRVSYRDERYVDDLPMAPRPPVPPAPRLDPDPDRERLARRDELRAERPAPSPRAEPKLDWRR